VTVSLSLIEPTNCHKAEKNKRLGNSWAFYQLRQYLTYKAVKFGVKLIFVNPRYSSQMCLRANTFTLLEVNLIEVVRSLPVVIVFGLEMLTKMEQKI
jgi:hypothetical protein